MSKILIIDDDRDICELLARSFENITPEVYFAFTLSDGLEHLRSGGFDVVLLDVYLPDGNGIEAICTIKAMAFAAEILIMTGDGDMEAAKIAMMANVWDYIQKTVSHKLIRLSLSQALEYRQQKLSRPAFTNKIKRDSIIGHSAKILACLEKISYAADDIMPVMIMGDTGTGKELFARAIHNNSNRKNKEFVVVDCAALPEHLVESILFGHVKGAFTGANTDNEGLLKIAHGGTLFLDEIGELPLEIQKKFLRALQEKRFRPIGSKEELLSDFRFVGATHRDLLGMVQKNEFREDLYYRIFSLRIDLPPLRQRKEDIALIAKDYVVIKNSLLKKEAFKMSEPFLEELENYNWPGNVRELKNTIDLACSQILHGETLFPRHLPEEIRSFNFRKKIAYRTNNESIPFSEIVSLKEHIDKTKYEYILNLLVYTKGDIKESCRLSGLSRGHLYNQFKKYGIKL